MENYIREEKIIEYQGKRIYGNAYLPTCKYTYPIVIFSHGYNGSSCDFESYGKFVAAHGIAAYCFDFCGGSVNSKSSLKTTEMTIFTEIEDLKAVIGEIKTWDKVSEIYLFGASQGGFVTALTSEEHLEDIKGVFLLFPAFCIPDDWTGRYAGVQSFPNEIELWGMILGGNFIKTIYGFDWRSQIGKYDKRVLIFHGDADGVVSQEYSLEIEKLYKNAKTVIFQGEGHGFSEEGHNKVIQMVVEAIKC